MKICKICKICKSPNSVDKEFSVDHCHKTGKIRGILCHACNVGLGAFRDNTDFMINAIKYLQENDY